MPADSEEDERAVNATEIKFRFAEENPSLFEGDIVLTLDQLAKTIEYARELLEMKKSAHSDNKKMSEVQRTITSDLSLRWITFPIPYVISGADANAVRAGIKNWEEATCVTFREVSSIPSRSSGLQFIKGQGLVDL
ncbi:hypothetical protein AB6A40_011065 [Gnathostoma spinigerum]|uniref:Peptidase M12A domain-containing protein n=1 Tax=Gnathostoma spinigerum TaxID=75299 RepID=A0ABD6F2B5_9BILA